MSRRALQTFHSIHTDVMMRFRPALLAMAIFPVVAGCADVTGPDPAFSLRLSADSTGPMRHGRYESGIYRIECPVTLRATAPMGTVTWSDATLRWINAVTGATTTTRTYSATEVADLWNGKGVNTGESVTADLVFWDAEPFRLELSFRYRVNGGQASANYTLRCEPPAPPLRGRYLLTTINDRWLPTRSGSWTRVHTNTLEFFPNLTYTLHSTVEAYGTYSHTEGPMPYGIISADTVVLPTIVAGGPGGRVFRSGTSLFFTERDCCGRPEYLWRWDLDDPSAPLPPRPSLVVTPDTLFFTAVSNGPVPEEQRFEVRSSTNTPIEELRVGTSIGTDGPAWAMGSAGSTTPYTIWVRPQRTDIVPGTYTITVYISSVQAANSPKVVEVVYQILDP